MRLLSLLLVFVALAMAGCAGHDSNAKSTLDERGRDSVLARSALPGAATVGKALELNDHAAARATSLDSLTQ